jgi:hypothetical protein
MAIDTIEPQATLDNYWFHLELGAANYGETGHTRESQEKTVFYEFTHVTDKPNYKDQLENNYTLIPDEQYRVLFLTLDKLVQANDGRVVFHVNDLFENWTQTTTTALQNYAANKVGYDTVRIEAVVGNYTQLNATHYLAKYGRVKYDSAHLKNPEVSFYNYGIDGEDMLYNENSRAKARERLQGLANLACTGLFFFPINPYGKYWFIPQEEYTQYIDQQIFYKHTDEWDALPYVFPEGGEFDIKYAAVYFIETNVTNNKC